MARMLPSRLPDNVTSHAERRMFETIRTGLSDEWTALYSVGLTVHPGKPWAEIDYVLVGPTGVYCLEVKGGRVSRSDGLWHFTNRYDETNVKRQGPFEQAGSASAALRKYLVERFPSLAQVAVGYGVATPDIRFTVTGPDIEPELVYDERDSARPFREYVARLGNYWAERVSSVQRSPVALPTPKNVQHIVEELRPDFDLKPSLNALLRRTHDQLLRLTREQFKVLDGLEDNPRVVVQGGAGTGKTLLAVEEAIRWAQSGARVFLCCYNKQLAQFLRKTMCDYPSVEVYHLHGFMVKKVNEANMAGRLKSATEGDELFRVVYPQVCLDALLETDQLGIFDALIVDEAQDLLSGPYIEVFDAVLAGGIANGQWRMFLDPNQDIFAGTVRLGLETLASGHPVRLKLSVNCRNTAPIGVATSLLSGTDADKTLGADGPEVQQYWYRDEAHQRREVSKCINRLLSEGVQPSDIVILSRYRRERSCLRDGLLDVSFRLVDYEAETEDAKRSVIRYSTVAAFKGLETEVAALVDVDDLDGQDALSAVYVGTSRARALLVLFISDALRGAYARRAADYGTRLAARGNARHE